MPGGKISFWHTFEGKKSKWEDFRRRFWADEERIKSWDCTLWRRLKKYRLRRLRTLRWLITSLFLERVPLYVDSVLPCSWNEYSSTLTLFFLVLGRGTALRWLCTSMFLERVQLYIDSVLPCSWNGYRGLSSFVFPTRVTTVEFCCRFWSALVRK